MSSSSNGLDMPRRLFAVIAVSMGVMISVMDSVIFNIALPMMAQDLRVSSAFTILLVNAHQVAVTIALLPLANLSDILGYRRVFTGALVLIMLGALGGYLADSFAWLTAFRVIQGVGAAGVMSVGSALVRIIYPSHLLGRGIGINAMVVAASASLGPTVAGVILNFATWRSLFVLYLPLGILALVLGRKMLPADVRHAGRFDFASALLNALTMGLIMLAVAGLSQGRSPAAFSIQLLAGLFVGYLFVRRQLRQDKPMLPLDLLRTPVIGLSALTSTISFTGQMLALVCLPFYLQVIMLYDVTTTGLVLAAWPLTVMVLAPVWGYVADRQPAGVVGAIGLIVASVGLSCLAAAPAQASVPDLIWRLVLCGMGYGLFQIPNTRTIVQATPKARSGAAGGLIATARMTGQTAGTVLLASVFNFVQQDSETTALMLAAVLTLMAAGVSSLRLLFNKCSDECPSSHPICQSTKETPT